MPLEGRDPKRLLACASRENQNPVAVAAGILVGGSKGLRARVRKGRARYVRVPPGRRIKPACADRSCELAHIHRDRARTRHVGDRERTVGGAGGREVVETTVGAVTGSDDLVLLIGNQPVPRKLREES